MITGDLMLRFSLALIFVIGLIGLLAFAARRFGFAPRMKFGRSRRLAMVETIALDAKNRLVLIRRDATEHLILLGPGTPLLIEPGIPATLPPYLPPT